MNEAFYCCVVLCLHFPRDVSAGDDDVPAAVDNAAGRIDPGLLGVGEPGPLVRVDVEEVGLAARARRPGPVRSSQDDGVGAVHLKARTIRV